MCRQKNVTRLVRGAFLWAVGIMLVTQHAVLAASAVTAPRTKSDFFAFGRPKSVATAGLGTMSFSLPRIVGGLFMPAAADRGAPATQSQRAKITSLQINRNGSTAELVVQTNKPASIRTARRGSVLIAVFENVQSTVVSGEYVPGIYPFDALNLRKSRVNPGVVGLTIHFNGESYKDAEIETRDNEIRVGVSVSGTEKSMQWSAPLKDKNRSVSKTIDGEKENSAVNDGGEPFYPGHADRSNDSAPERLDRQEAKADVGPDIKTSTTGDASTHSQQEIVYHVRGRDPFIPLNEKDVYRADLPDVTELKLVGVLYDKDDRVALFEDLSNENQPYAMRERDRVRSGRVFRIQENRVIFLLNESGISHTFTLDLHKSQDN